MSTGVSSRIVDFISALLPLYTQEMVDDEALLLPREADEDEDGRVTVFWQGDRQRSSEIAGAFMASAAVARYVEMHAVSVGKLTKEEFEHLANHFTVKTGQSLIFEFEDTDDPLLKLVGRAAARFGSEAVIAVIRSHLGF